MRNRYENVCPTCDGEGFIPYDGFGDVEKLLEGYSAVCPECGGCGFLRHKDHDYEAKFK